MRDDVIVGVMHFICSITANFRFCLFCTRVPTVWVSDYYFQMTLPITIGIQYVYVFCEILAYTQGTHPHHIQFVQGCDIRGDICYACFACTGYILSDDATLLTIFYLEDSFLGRNLNFPCIYFLLLHYTKYKFFLFSFAAF